LRKLAILAPICALVFLAQLASAQQGDIMFGGGTLLSSAPTSNTNFAPAERGGTYLNIDGDVVGFKHRLGLNIGTSWRASQASYAGQSSINYRPILTDFNALFQPKLGKKFGADLFGGVGIANTRFYYQQIVSCTYFGGCVNYNSTNHFVEDLGAGLRYYFWHHVFVRPEVHYYHIQNNTDQKNQYGFSSNNVVRVGASIGYTIGND
jgi:opacity protein-like surface antigen